MSLSMRLTGTEAEIEYTLTALRMQGYEWKGDNRRYPQRNDPNRVSCYLNDVIAPPLIQAAPTATRNDGEPPQPRPWDAVLGGNGQQKRGHEEGM
jgi:hypothetical protein